MSETKRQKLRYTMRSTVRTLSLKFYAEQVLPNGGDASAAKAVLEQRVKAVDKDDVQIIAIMHDRDPMTDDIWAPSMEKPHFHVIMRVVGSPNRRISQLLGMVGVTYRQDPDGNGEPVDRKLWENHGVETVKKFANYAMYLTHDTEEAISEGKFQYGLDELFSNMTQEEIKLIRDGYISPSRVKVTGEVMSELDQAARQMGYEMQNYTKWVDQLPFEVRSHAKMRAVRESYDRGVTMRIEERTQIVRLCVFIQGKPDTGKSYASAEALKHLGKSVLNVSGGGTGRFDSLRPDHDAIVIDDDVCPNLLNMSDNYICRAYRRNRNNQVWAGRYLIVTSNLDFDAWMEACSISEKNREAVRSRFYICHLEKRDGVNCLDLDSASRRGSNPEQRERLEMFRGFREKFDAVISGYEPGSCDIDYDWLEGRPFKSFNRGEEVVHRAHRELEEYKDLLEENPHTRRRFPLDQFMQELKDACGGDDDFLEFFTGRLHVVDAAWDEIEEVAEEWEHDEHERLIKEQPEQPQPGINYYRN